MKKWILGFFVLTSTLSACASNESFTRGEVKKMQSYFVSKGCDIQSIYQLINDYKLKPGVIKIEDIPNEGKEYWVPLEKLSNPELCVISRSSEMTLFLHKIRKNGSLGDIERYTGSYPKNFKPNSVRFDLPGKLQVKCNDDIPAVGAKVDFEKIDGKISGKIILFEDDLDCAIKQLRLPASIK